MTEKITREEIEALLKLAEAATPGPWKKGISGNSRVYGPDNAGGYSGLVAHFARWQDRDFIAAANPAAVLKLIADLTSAKAEIERLREALRPKYAYDPACWETTVPAEKLDLLFDDTGEKGPFPVVLLAELPKQWAVRFANEEFWTSDFITFPTEDEAQRYLRAAAAVMGEEPRTCKKTGDNWNGGFCECGSTDGVCRTEPRT